MTGLEVTGGVFAGFGSFLKRNRWAVLAALVVVIVSYGFMLTHYTLSIDEEIWVKNTDPALLKSIWLNQGHFGLFFFDILFFPNGNYVPILWDWFGVILFSFGGVLLAFAVSRLCENMGKLAVFVFCALFPVLPFVTGDILSFSMYGVPMGIAMVIMALAVLFLYAGYRKRKIWFFIVSALLAFVGTSFYQAFPGIYVVGLMAYAVMMLYQAKEKPLRIVKDVLWGLAALGAAVGAYLVLNDLLQTAYGLTGSGSYLSDGFIGWGTGDALLVFGGTARSVAAVLAGRVFGGLTVLLMTVTFIVFMVVLAVCKQKNRAVWVIGCLLLIVSPFVMNLMLGSQGLTGRTLLGLPFALAMEALLITDAAQKRGRRWLCVSVTVFMCGVLAINAGYMNFLFWMDHTTYQKDQNTSIQIMDEISARGMDAKEKPVIFVGKLEPVFEGSFNTPATASFFNWDGGSNYRIHGFLNAEGYEVLPYTQSQLEEAAEAAKTMPNWPAEGSVAQTQSSIVIKLSAPPESSWFDINRQIVTEKNRIEGE